MAPAHGFGEKGILASGGGLLSGGRHWEAQAPTEAELALRDAIQRAAVGHRFYGYRRVAVLVQRKGYEVGAKKVRRLMKEDHLLAVRRRKFVATTDSAHRLVDGGRGSGLFVMP